MTRTHVTVLAVLLLLAPATGTAQPPDMDDAAIGPVRVETLELEPTVVKTGDLILQRYRVRFPDLIDEGQEIIMLEDRMAPETLPVHPFEGVSLSIDKARVDDEHIWVFTYGFRLVDPSKMTYLLPNFSFYYLVRDLGEDIEDAEVQQVDGGQGLVRYVTTITDEPILAIRDTIELGSFAGRSMFFRTLAWTVAPLPMVVWLVMLLRLARTPTPASIEKAEEAEELARIEAQIPIPPSIWEARRNVRRQLKTLEDMPPSANGETLADVQRGLVLSFRDYLQAQLPDLHTGDTARDIHRHVEGLADGPRRDALHTLTSRMVAYQRGLEYGEPAPIESPGDEARSLKAALSRLRPHVRVLNRMMGACGTVVSVMFMPWSELAAFLDSGFRELVETDFAQIRYGDVGMATWLGIGVGMALVLTVVRLAARRKRHVRQHSGHVIAVSHRKRLWIRLAHSAPKLLLAAALVLLVVSVADPFLTATEEVSGYVESRIRIDLVDTSGSMAWEFPDTNKSKAEVARDAHLEFLDMRRDKNDRVSLWLFSTYPYMVDDFVMDDELYYYQVWDAPYVMTQRLDKAMVVPRDKVRIIPAEGDTNIVRPLQDIVKHFDRDEAAVGRGSNQNRAVLIITDAAVDEFPDAEFAELNKRNIVPYIIYINTSDARTASFLHPTVPQLVSQIQEYGGDYFDVTDEDSLTKAYQAIDEREAVRVELRHRALKVPIYSRFLLVAMGLLAVGIPMGFVSELLWGTSP